MTTLGYTIVVGFLNPWWMLIYILGSHWCTHLTLVLTIIGQVYCLSNVPILHSLSKNKKKNTLNFYVMPFWALGNFLSHLESTPLEKEKEKEKEGLTWLI